LTLLDTKSQALLCYNDPQSENQAKKIRAWDPVTKLLKVAHL